jgi:hypothetical protein
MRQARDNRIARTTETGTLPTSTENDACAMYITYTISEDRTGTADEVMSKRLAALTSDRHRSKKNEKKKPPRRNAWGMEESESSTDKDNGRKGPDKDPDRVLIEFPDIQDAIVEIRADVDALEMVQDTPTDTPLSQTPIPILARMRSRDCRLRLSSNGRNYMNVYAG